MTNYAKIIYPPDEENTYPKQLCDYIFNRFFNNKVDREIKILDIGCCTGTALKNFGKNRPQVKLYGIDIREEEVDDNITFKKCDIETQSIPFEDNYFDFVYSKSVLEHVYNTENFLSESLRVLKPGGTFVGLTPDWKSQYEYFWDDYTHVKPFTRKGLRDGLAIAGFEQAGCEYFYQLPFVWKYPSLSFIPKLISFLPDFLKWKTSEQRNTKDRKLIRFSKEKMLLSYGHKGEESEIR